MAAIMGATVTGNRRGMLVTDQFNQITCTIAFGNGTDTYPTGGIPLLPNQFGFRQYIRDILFVDPSSGDGYIYKFDKATNKIRIYQSDAENADPQPLIELTTGDAPAATSLIVEAEGF